jgi:hypothetical protein
MIATSPYNPSIKMFRGADAKRKFRQIFFESITEDDMREISRQVIDRAREGDYDFCKLALEYTVGKPVQHVEVSEADPSDLTMMSTAEFAALLENTLTTVAVAGETKAIVAHYRSHGDS